MIVLFNTKSVEEGYKAIDVFREVRTQIGIPLAEHKSMGPAQILPFLGITLDTFTFGSTSSIGQGRKCRQGIEVFLSHEKVTLKELQSTLGLLSWACGVILPG